MSYKQMRIEAKMQYGRTNERVAKVVKEVLQMTHTTTTASAFPLEQYDPGCDRTAQVL